MSLAVRGVSYMVDEVPTDVAAGDLGVIRHRLHCTAVILIGMSLERMTAAAAHALALGLDVWLEPHPVNMRHRKVLANLLQFAAAAETLRRQHPDRVKLIVGCEFSLHLNAGLPGLFELVRMWMLRYRHWFAQRINRKVNKLVHRLVFAAREHFAGPITYASAAWELIDWSCCDYKGINLYRTENNSATFVGRLHAEVTYPGMPLVITEFGCGTHIGAAQRGPGAFKIVKWFHRYPRVKSGSVRSERVQAAYVGSLIDLWDAFAVHGCFVYTFALRDYPHHPDPRRDLDMASFGLVKFDASDVARWQPKLAFHTVEGRYRRLQQRERLQERRTDSA